ncbi:unnamed protein product [Caenorhabditis nigoni]
MKSLIVLIGILALFHLQSNAIKMELKSIANKEEYLKGINDIRRAYAKKAKIPNMYKLIWDDFLETKTQMDDHSGEGETMRINRRDGDAATTKRMQKQIKRYFGTNRRSELIKKYKGHHMTGLEGLTPGQQRIGCSPKKTQIIVANSTEKLNFDTMCFMGPEGTGISWDMKLGAPGSACAQGFENDDGLCSPIQKAPESSRESSRLESADPNLAETQKSNIPTDNVSNGAQIWLIFLIIFLMIYSS